MKNFLRLFLTLLLIFCFACQNHSSQNDKESIAPEHTHQIQKKEAVYSKHWMLSTANPIATKIGYDILKSGGNAVDAAVAVQMVLNLVEPQSSGIGGGLFLLYYDAENKKMMALDGRETAPKTIKSNVFLDNQGKPLKFIDAIIGGKSVGTPGVLKALKTLHEKYGKLPWKELFEPAIELAENGFPISQRLHDSIVETKYLKNSPSAKTYFYQNDGKTPKEVGQILMNQDLAHTFTVIANEGIDSFYGGDLGQQIVNAVHNSYKDPGALSLEDLKNYQAKERAPVCLMYRQYKVCGMSPPTSGGITVLQILGILENFDLKNIDPLSAKAVHLFSEASKLAYADRAVYLADPDYVPVPTDRLLNKNYLKKRASLIKETNFGTAKAGELNVQAENWAQDQSLEIPCTSHFSIVDADGNAISLTTSIESAFGSTLIAAGFLLNNQLTDFSFVSMVDGKRIANRIEPGKRPRSSMSPMFVFDQSDQLMMVIGSPGGSRIIEFVAKTIIAVLDWNLDIQKAIDLPNYANRGDFIELEEYTALKKIEKSLKDMGHKVEMLDMNSGLQGIVVVKDGLIGGADKRREGLVMGE